MSLLSLSTRYLSLRYCLTALVLIAVNGVAYGQITPGTVTGNSKPVEGAIIKNLKSGNVSMSGATGNFIIALKKGDTLLTDYSGFITDTLIYKDQSQLLITLKPLPSLLDEVTISERRLNPLEKFQKNQDDYKQIYRIGDDRGVFLILPGFPVAGLAISIDALYSHFSKAGKNARRLQKTLVRDYHDDIIDTRFTKELVAKLTGYDGDQLVNFMIDNRPDYKFIQHASDYDVMEYILKAKKNVVINDNLAVFQNKAHD